MATAPMTAVLIKTLILKLRRGKGARRFLKIGPAAKQDGDEVEWKKRKDWAAELLCRITADQGYAGKDCPALVPVYFLDLRLRFRSLRDGFDGIVLLAA